ncbi:gliding motility-associated protein GldE [Dinghuibacter silviterrae]|uniref:Gliding motility-associated protein GldE n=1 Tax=Dinghuibacter silviterrae TaxID=1539049 RepID=A0A4R8DQ21_9BACT|nr:gliding motility-associated protein GldE [Dinghuibacter silviterrae]TDW99504.1 gliding motility-associated protein GldE [Dinghuibacter silviterrae]
MDHPPNAPILLTAINTQGTTVWIVLFIALIFLLFVVSGSEIALFTLTYKDQNILKTKQVPYARRITTLLEEPKILLASLQCASGFLHIVLILMANSLIDTFLPMDPALFWVVLIVKILVITIVLLLLCDVLPRVYASQNNIRFAKFSSWWLDALVVPLFRRTGQFMVRMSEGVETGLGIGDATEYSLQQIDQEETSQEERNILKGIVKFGNITVKQVMRTRLDVSGLDYTLTLAEVLRRVEDLHYSRLPVYKNDLDEVAGILNTKDLLPYIGKDSLQGFDWHSLLRPVYFVPQNKLIDDLLKEFQHKRTHIAVVVDEFGGTSGIVTLEDILEEIIGDIKDEFDDEESVNKKLDDNNFIFEGRTSILDVCKAMDLPLDTFESVRGESDSLAGLVLELAGKFPALNEVITTGEFDFAVLEINRNRIQKVKVTIKRSS